MKMEWIKYKLFGFVVVTDWYGSRGWMKVEFETDEKGLEYIRKDPLQDYICFGVQSVDYAYFDVYKIEVVEDEAKRQMVTIEDLEILERIEKGVNKLSDSEMSCLMDELYTDIGWFGAPKTEEENIK